MTQRGSSPWWLSVVTLVVGLGVGYVLWADKAPSSKDDDALDVTDPVIPAAEALPLRDAGATLKGSGDNDPLTRLLRSAPAVEPEHGDGTIQGKVLDQAGAPVEGVTMRLEAIADRARFFPKQQPHDPDERLERMIRGMIESHRWQGRYRQLATTAADGSFAFGNLVDMKFRVTAEKPGWRIHLADHTLYQGAPIGSTLPFRAQQLTQMRLVVHGEHQPDRLKVVLKSGGSHRHLEWTPAGSVLDVDPGSYELTVTGGKSGELRGGPYPVTLAAGGEPTLVEVVLESRPVLHLTVKFDPDEGQHFDTYFMPWTGSKLPAESVLRARGQQDHHWHHMRRGMGVGQFKLPFEDVKPGTYVFGLGRSNANVLDVVEVVNVGTGITEHTVEVPAMDPSRYVLVTVHGPDGAVVPEPRFSVGWFREGSSRSGGSQTVRRKDGRTLVMHARGDGAKGGTWWIQAQAEGIGSKRVEYDPATTRELTIRFDAPGELDVQVRGVIGTEYEGRVRASLHRVSEQGHGGGQSNAELDAKGNVSFKGLQPGEYRLQLMLMAGRHRNHSVAEFPVAVGAGANSEAVTLPTLHAVTVRGATRSAHISRQREPGVRRIRGRHFSAHTPVGADGVAIFDGLPPGTYRIQSGRKMATVTVPGTSEVTLEEQRRGR